MSRHSPIAIEIMLACYYSPEPWHRLGQTWESRAGVECRERLYREGLITALFGATERGRKWVDAICSTPLPAMPRKHEQRVIAGYPPLDYVGTPEQWAEDMRKERD